MNNILRHLHPETVSPAHLRELEVGDILVVPILKCGRNKTRNRIGHAIQRDPTRSYTSRSLPSEFEIRRLA